VLGLASHGALPWAYVLTYTGVAFRVAALDKLSGLVIWEYDSAPAGNQVAPSLLVAPDGSRVFVAATTVGVPQFGALYEFTDPLAFALDALSGAELWSGAYDWSGEQESFDHDDTVAAWLSADGQSLFLLGSTLVDGPFPFAYLFTRLDSSNGAAVWQQVVAAPVGTNSQPRDLGVSPDGTRVFGLATDVSQVLGGLGQFGVSAVDAAGGQLLWQRAAFASPNPAARKLEVARDGSEVYVSGRVQGLVPSATNGEAELLALGEGRTLLFDGQGERLYLAWRSVGDGRFLDLAVAAIDRPRLTPFPAQISPASGGSQHFDLSGGGGGGR
jgi:outer membrane protein assembly factor BamB